MENSRSFMDKIKSHNKELRDSAEYRADQMRTWPTPLEERMKAFLSTNGVRYEDQKIFYIYAEDGWIITYYIADFYVPESDIIIEVDGKFHDNQKSKDRRRSREIQDNYPNIRIFRYRGEDFSNEDKMGELLQEIYS